MSRSTEEPKSFLDFFDDRGLERVIVSDEIYFIPELERTPEEVVKPYDEGAEIQIGDFLITQSGEFINLKKYPQFKYREPGKKKARVKHKFRKMRKSSEKRDKRKTTMRASREGKPLKTKAKTERKTTTKIEDPYVMDLNPLATSIIPLLEKEETEEIQDQPKLIELERAHDSYYEDVPIIYSLTTSSAKEALPILPDSNLSLASEPPSEDEIQKSKKKKVGKKSRKTTIAKASSLVEMSNDTRLLIERRRNYADFAEVDDTKLFLKEKLNSDIIDLILQTEITDNRFNFRLRRAQEREEREQSLMNRKKMKELRGKGTVTRTKSDDVISLDEEDERELFHSCQPLRLVMDSPVRFQAMYPGDDLEATRTKDMLHVRPIRDAQRDWDFDLITLPFDDEVRLCIAYYNRERKLLDQKRIQLKKKKKIKAVTSTLKELRLNRALVNLDSEYPWNVRIYSPSKRMNVMPPIHGNIFIINESPSKHARSKSHEGILTYAKLVAIQNNYFDFPSRKGNEIREQIRELNKVFAETNFSLVQYLFLPLFPADGGPMISNFHKFYKKYILETPHIYSAIGTPPKTPTASFYDSAELLGEGSSVESEIEPEEEMEEGMEEMDEEEEDLASQKTKQKEAPVDPVADYLKEEYDRALRQRNMLCFEAAVTPEVKKQEHVSTLTSVNCTHPSYNEYVNGCTIVPFYLEVLEEAGKSKKAYNPVWLLIQLIKTRAKWRDIPTPEKIFVKRKYLRNITLINRLTNMNVDFPLAFAYTRIRFGKSEESRRAFRKILTVKYKKILWPVIEIQWHPVNKSILYVLYSKFDIYNQKYGVLNYGKGYFAIFETQYRHKATFAHYLDVSPTCMAIHPTQSKYILVGQLNGHIRWYNMGYYTVNKYKCVVTDNQLASKIVQLSWLETRYKGRELIFFSVSEQGVVHKWRIHRTYIQALLHLKFSKSPSTYLGGLPHHSPVLITCAAFNPSFPKVFLLATYGGKVLQCHAERVDGPVFEYQSSGLVTALCYNILCPKVFLTCNMFRLITIWQEMNSQRIIAFFLEEDLIHCEWAPFSSTVFLTAHSKAIFVFDISLTLTSPEEMENVIDESEPATITTFKICRGKKYLVAVSDTLGKISFLKLAPDIRGIFAKKDEGGGGGGEEQVWTIEDERYKLTRILENTGYLVGNLEEPVDTCASEINTDLDNTLSTVKSI